jgi:Heterokaryon incompatibility protein (HET)
MRLLEYNNEGDFRLTDSFGDETPQYAILSHTWGAGEVTFKDLVDDTGKGKAGYRKIQFCGQQARRDGLKYFWVDTCCIDKSNSTELAKAINSMFRWYRNATKCYVYLSDVYAEKQKTSDPSSDRTSESAFQRSRWFTRGWTLQELLAPCSVEFFSQEGKLLGDKKSLERQIHERTGIAVAALQGTPLSHFGVDERLSWAANRQTTCEEDGAYSLLGIFNVFMSLIYGEGRDNAFIRLRNKIDKPLKGGAFLCFNLVK